MKHLRIPLTIGVIYTANGAMIPRTIIYNGEKYLIDKVIYKRNYYPRVVSTVAPTEYTVMVMGEVKKIYFERDTGKWFSIKDVLESDETPSAKDKLDDILDI